MLQSLRKLIGDLLGLRRICGWRLALRWLVSVASNAPEIIRTGNLKAADVALGSGPFEVHHPAASQQFEITGPNAVSGIREMYVRDTYLHGGLLAIRDGDTVVDLGANMGNFTNLALAHGPAVRVIAVEPNARLNDLFERSLARNGWRERVTLLRAFLGSDSVDPVVLASVEEYEGAELLDETAFIERARLDRIDFLKCDIEGAEFTLFDENSLLLEMTDKIAIEVHSFGGDVKAFISMLQQIGFRILEVKEDPDGTSTVLARKQNDSAC